MPLRNDLKHGYHRLKTKHWLYRAAMYFIDGTLMGSTARRGSTPRAAAASVFTFIGKVNLEEVL
jgi:hypothetical protein